MQIEFHQRKKKGKKTLINQAKHIQPHVSQSVNFTVNGTWVRPKPPAIAFPRPPLAHQAMSPCLHRASTFGPILFQVKAPFRQGKRVLLLIFKHKYLKKENLSGTEPKYIGREILSEQNYLQVIPSHHCEKKTVIIYPLNQPLRNIFASNPLFSELGGTKQEGGHSFNFFNVRGCHSNQLILI